MHVLCKIYLGVKIIFIIMNKGGREVGRGTAISKADSSHLYEAYQHDTPGLSQGQLEEPTLSKNLWVTTAFHHTLGPRRKGEGLHQV